MLCRAVSRLDGSLFAEACSPRSGRAGAYVINDFFQGALRQWPDVELRVARGTPLAIEASARLNGETARSRPSDGEPRIDLADALANRRRQGVRRTGVPYRERSRAQRRLDGGAEHRRRGRGSQVVVAGVPNDADDLDLAPLLRLESEPPAHCVVGPEKLRRGGGIDHRDARRVPVVARLQAASR